MRKRITQILLAVLNSRWFNQTPCRYDFVGNIDNFSREDIESNLREERSYAPAFQAKEWNR
jgi:hypothetical protein